MYFGSGIGTAERCGHSCSPMDSGAKPPHWYKVGKDAVGHDRSGGDAEVGAQAIPVFWGGSGQTRRRCERAARSLYRRRALDRRGLLRAADFTRHAGAFGCQTYPDPCGRQQAGDGALGLFMRDVLRGLSSSASVAVEWTGNDLSRF